MHIFLCGFLWRTAAVGMNSMEKLHFYYSILRRIITLVTCFSGILNKFLNSYFKKKEENFDVKKLTMHCIISFLNNAACHFIKQDLGKLLYDSYPHIDL